MISATIPDRVPPFDSSGDIDDPSSIGPVRVALHTGAQGHSFFVREAWPMRYIFGSVSFMKSAR